MSFSDFNLSPSLCACSSNSVGRELIHAFLHLHLHLHLHHLLLIVDVCRCELFVSGGGVTEKLASGFLKPFLIHLRALKDQITSQTGRESVIRLDHPQNSNINAASWFTKGILDR